MDILWYNYNSREGASLFLGEGTINSMKYNQCVLSKIQDYFELHAIERLVFI